MKDEQQFNKLYNDTKRTIHNMSVKYHKRSGVPVDELTSQLNEELWFAYRDYDESKNAKLMTWVNGCLTRRAIDVIREREGSYRRTVTHSVEPPDSLEEFSNTVTSDIDSGVRTEEIVLERLKEADQRQLIDSITRSVKTDTTMTSIIAAYETAHPSASPNAIAKTLGIHHETVNRKLRKLGRQFDSSRYGDIRDIIAV